jgi:hypothetical protein
MRSLGLAVIKAKSWPKGKQLMKSIQGRPRADISGSDSSLRVRE